jgi:beta-galactosidase
LANVTYDERSYLLDGSRIWLTSGAVHYFRTPAGLWRDRLLKAKRSGLNCIETYVAWNFHEMQEGKWDFGGDRDVAGFIRLAGELGLYVILRPGPYICAEWDFGGLPAWLTTKPGIAYRTNNASFTHYYDKYFRQVLPKLAEQQVTRGGNIVLIQNENEYYMSALPEGLAYLEFISQLFRRSGFDIPIIHCNMLHDPHVPGTIQCVNSYNECIQQLKQLRTRQPKAPMMVTEFWPGWFDYWGNGEHQRRDARTCARRALEIVGCGAQINYYMWHGGTNFGFWGSRLGATSSCYQTTSYDYDAPLSEGGGLTKKYYLTKLVNMFSSNMGQFLATCSMGQAPTSVHDSTNVLNLSGANAQWAIVSNSGRDDIKTAKVSLPNGVELVVNLEAFGATAVPFNLQLTAQAVLDYSSLMPLGFFHDKTLILHGPVGFEGAISINGSPRQVVVPAGDGRVAIETNSLLVVVINTDLAKRTWLVDNSLVLGPDFVGDTLDQISHAHGAKEYALIGPDAKITVRKIAKTPAEKLTPPRLSAWKLSSVCSEPSVPADPTITWQKIDKPKDVDTLGMYYGYVWYKVEIDSPKACTRHLAMPDCKDRATVYHNGQLLGVYGSGDGASRKLLTVQMVRGKNVLVAMLDNMGRYNFGPNLGELKGLYGHIYDAKNLHLPKLKLTRLETFAKRILPRRLIHLLPQLEKLPLWQVQITLPMKQIAPVLVGFQDVPHHVAVLCNDRVAAFLPCVGGGYNDGSVTLSAELQKGKNNLELLIWGNEKGDVKDAVLDKFHFYNLSENLSADAAWSVRHWALPAAESRPARHGQNPTWLSSHFDKPASQSPLFLHLKGKGKGQIFLNGHNLGRYWLIGPQEYYYLPADYMTDDNEIMIFCESAAPPERASLEFRPAGPFE